MISTGNPVAELIIFTSTLLDRRDLHVDLPVPGDLQREPVGGLRVHVLVGEQDRVGGLQNQLLRQLVHVE
jgi:hypothetical protein